MDIWSPTHFSGYKQLLESTVACEEVFVATNKLKAAKNDGDIGLSSDYFKHSCHDLAVYISLLFTALLVHGTAPS